MSEVIRLKHPALELTEHDYQTWKHHPMGQIFFRWVEDKLEDYRQGAADRIEYGTIDATELTEFKNRINFCKELKDLSLKDIQTFYIQPEAAKREP